MRVFMLRSAVAYGLILSVVCWVAPVAAKSRPAQPRLVAPFEAARSSIRSTPIDKLVESVLEKHNIKPANLCSDEVFIRRVYLDVIGMLPTPKEVLDFVKNEQPRKRAELIDSLLDRDEYADYWSMKWCDLLRVKAEFPINLWPNGVQAYYNWIHDSLKKNKHYDEFARELLTSSGSNYRVPPVNFYRAIQGHKPSSIASAVALTFMGSRIQGWPENLRTGMETMFSRVAYKGTAEWKEEIVYLDPSATGPLDAVLPDGSKVHVPAGQDPRRAFADWLISPDNPWFARNIVNRVWYWLMGRGIINEPDDIRPDNPPVNPELLAWLEKQFVKSDYDLRQLYRLILNSRTYQQSSIPRGNQPEAETLFAVYPVHQLDAEVIIDALNWIFGSSETYSSAIPEPYTFIPTRQRSVLLADGSITSPFLEMFGRPPRDTGLESERNNKPTSDQQLHLLNSSHIQGKIQKSWWLNGVTRGAKNNHRKVINAIYLKIMSRLPTQSEIDATEQYVKTSRLGIKQASGDLAWALINSKEFLYQH